MMETKHADFWKVVPNHDESQTPEVQADHKLAIEKETHLPSSRQDAGKIGELMKSTFTLRRGLILNSVSPVEIIVKEYPPLSTGVGVSPIAVAFHSQFYRVKSFGICAVLLYT